MGGMAGRISFRTAHCGASGTPRRLASSRNISLAAAADRAGEQCCSTSSRRLHLLGVTGAAAAAALSGLPAAAVTLERESRTTVTDTVFLDLAMCPNSLRTDRAMGDKSALCLEPTPIGRVEIGLYGDLLPATTAAFRALVTSGDLVGTTFSKVFPGEYVLAGQQGSRRYGFVDPRTAEALPPNPEVLQGASFDLGHSRPGTVSLALGVNPDEAFMREGKAYKPTSFLITTGPGPDFDLDGTNIVFGRVTAGMEAVATVAAVPTFSPMMKMKQLNKLASVFGDERATKSSKTWGKPQKAIVITGGGVV